MSTKPSLLYLRTIPAMLQSPHGSINNVHRRISSSSIPAFVSRNFHVSIDNAVLKPPSSLQVNRLLAGQFQYSSSSHPSTSQPLPIAFDDLMIAKGEDEELIKKAFGLVNIVASPLDCRCWSITRDRKGLERKFTFKTFTICWVRQTSEWNYCEVKASQSWRSIGTSGID